MRRTRRIGFLIATILIIIGIAVALVIKNYVAAEDGEEVLSSVSIGSTSMEDGQSTISIGATGDLVYINATITFDSSKFDFVDLGVSGVNESQAGTVSIASTSMPSTVFALSAKDGASGSGSCTLNVSELVINIDGVERTLTADNIGNNGCSTTITIPDEPDPPAPTYDDPYLSPSSIQLTSLVPVARILCIHPGCNIESWSCSDENLVTLSANGDAAIVSTTADTDGEVTITVTFDNDKTATASITVVAAEVEPDIPVDPDEPVNPDDFPDIPVVDGAPVIEPSGNQTLVIGDTLQMRADQSGVTWTSSDTSVAIVDSSTGFVSAIGKGAAIITVRNNSGKSTSFYVIVNDKQNGNGDSNSSNNSSKTVTNIVNGTTPKGKETPTADDPVPQTGENTLEIVVLIGIITFVIATIIFRKKSRRN